VRLAQADLLPDRVFGPDLVRGQLCLGNPFPHLVGLYTGILNNPNGPEDFIGSGNLKEADATIMWFGPNARCVGPNGSTTPYSPGAIKTYRLVDANA
jgi:hypothetical protein